jgi:S1-C subfamily serine protease
VREVIADSPADEAGLRVGDLIMSVDDVPLDANHRLADMLATYEPGDQVELQVLRGERSLSLDVRLGENEEGAPYLGIRYVDMFRERQAPAD